MVLVSRIIQAFNSQVYGTLILKNKMLKSALLVLLVMHNMGVIYGAESICLEEGTPSNLSCLGKTDIITDIQIGNIFGQHHCNDSGDSCLGGNTTSKEEKLVNVTSEWLTQCRGERTCNLTIPLTLLNESRTVKAEENIISCRKFYLVNYTCVTPVAESKVRNVLRCSNKTHSIICPEDTLIYIEKNEILRLAKNASRGNRHSWKVKWNESALAINCNGTQQCEITFQDYLEKEPSEPCGLILNVTYICAGEQPSLTTTLTPEVFFRSSRINNIFSSMADSAITTEGTISTEKLSTVQSEKEDEPVLDMSDSILIVIVLVAGAVFGVAITLTIFYINKFRKRKSETVELSYVSGNNKTGDSHCQRSSAHEYDYININNVYCPEPAQETPDSSLKYDYTYMEQLSHPITMYDIEAQAKIKKDPNQQELGTKKFTKDSESASSMIDNVIYTDDSTIFQDDRIIADDLVNNSIYPKENGDSSTTASVLLDNDIYNVEPSSKAEKNAMRSPEVKENEVVVVNADLMAVREQIVQLGDEVMSSCDSVNTAVE